MYCMCNKSQLLLLICLFQLVLTQAQNDITAKEVLSSYFEAVGGKEKWKALQSRKAEETIAYYNSEGKFDLVDYTAYHTKYFLAPNNYMDKKLYGFLLNLTCFTSDCGWIYFDEGQNIVFVRKEHLKKRRKLPRIGALEVLNNEYIDTVKSENNLLRIDFKYEKRDNGIESIYFDPDTFLIKKRIYDSQGIYHCEWRFSGYRKKDGFMEPYKIDFYVNDHLYSTTEVEEIAYNQFIDSQLFVPPVKCDVSKRVVHLSEPLSFVY